MVANMDANDKPYEMANVVDKNNGEYFSYSSFLNVNVFGSTILATS